MFTRGVKASKSENILQQQNLSKKENVFLILLQENRIFGHGPFSPACGIEKFRLRM
jgi:hypothetical protein